MLCARAERPFEEEQEAEGYLRREVACGRFERAISLPQGVKPEDITATYRDGILEVVVPKAAALPERKKVPVNVAGERT
jgi:HSP20 family protein